MSIASEISRLTQAKADIKTAIEAKGVTVPSNAKLDRYDDYIAQISGGGSRWPDMDEDSGLPAGYARLTGLRKSGSGGYINTGIVADSTTRLELMFSISNCSAESSVFGIRRASGSSDSYKFGLYARPQSYYGGFSVLFGTTDSGFIPGSGAACSFGDGMIKVTVSGGRWYIWDRLIFDGSGQSFSNPDDTPIFLGTLAKSPTAKYQDSSVYPIFYSFKCFDSSDVLTHDFVTVISPASQLGLYDKVTNTFIAVDSNLNWEPITPATYTYRSLRLWQRFASLQSGLNYQSATGYGNWVIVATDSQRYFLLSDTTYQLSSGSFAQSGYVLQCSEYNSNWHGNACWFSDTKYDPSDPFPILYVSTDKQNCLLVAYRITESGGTYSISIVQKISTPVGDTDFGATLYFHDYIGKPGGSTFLERTYKLNSYSSAEGNNLYYREFPLPAISAGLEVSLTEADIIKKGSLPFINGGQSGGWNGTYYYISSMTNLFYVFKITQSGAEMVHIENFNGSSFGKYYQSVQESEGLSWNAQLGCFIQLCEPLNGIVYRVYAEDLEQYV